MATKPNLLSIKARLIQVKLFALDRKHRPLAFLLAFAFIGSLVIAFSQAAVSTSDVEPEAGSSSLAGCTSRVSDTSASAGGAIQFGCTGSGPLALDNSGKTIPKNNYTPPANAIYMSPAGADKNSPSVEGNDTNNGTIGAPVRTINRAIALVDATTNKTTIVMRGGEYRDWNNFENKFLFQTKSLTLQAHPGESPWFNGADVIPSTDWSVSNNIWSRRWETPDFCNPGKYYLPVGNNEPPFSPNLTLAETWCGYGDSFKGSANVAGDPQSVFINDTKLAQVPSLSQLNSGSFYYDWFNKRMYIAQDPAGKKIEFSKRTQALVLSQGDYAIKGIGFKRYASGGLVPQGQTGNWTIGGAVYINSPRSSVVENTVFVDNSAIGLAYSQPKNNASKITNSVFAYNGYAGLHANGSRGGTNGGRDDFTILSNVFNANNDQSFDINCVGACGAANVKLNNMVGFVAKDNVIANAKLGGYGFWCDINCSDGVIVNNLVKNNAKVGIFYEISKDGTIASNVTVDNGQDGIAVGSANTNVYNNTVIFDRGKNPTGRGIYIFDDPRCAICWNDPGIGPDTRNIELVNNIVIARSGGELSVSQDSREETGKYATPETTTNTMASEFYDKFSHNAYHRTSTGANFYFWRYDNGVRTFDLKSTAVFTAATGWDTQSLDLTGSTIPYFIDLANGDYRLKTDSQPYINKGTAIPAEVATHLGVPANSVLPRGAINWPR
jgi:parallel beta-helix repeat protein